MLIVLRGNNLTKWRPSLPESREPSVFSHESSHRNKYTLIWKSNSFLDLIIIRKTHKTRNNEIFWYVYVGLHHITVCNVCMYWYWLTCQLHRHSQHFIPNLTEEIIRIKLSYVLWSQIFGKSIIGIVKWVMFAVFNSLMPIYEIE